MMTLLLIVVFNSGVSSHQFQLPPNAPKVIAIVT